MQSTAEKNEVYRDTYKLKECTYWSCRLAMRSASVGRIVWHSVRSHTSLQLTHPQTDQITYWMVGDVAHGAICRLQQPNKLLFQMM